ncbi:penicillin-binding protein [Gordonia sp. HY002]|nr:penicillin-binding transpeptidase domain-containing protein [Gordonia zhenghanii]MCF8569287.1 penicillin-binding protein [Gordonia zhenghanii]MCF8607197.1 penicillin-binding protein [Gordonia zhenghanii]
MLRRARHIAIPAVAILVGGLAVACGSDDSPAQQLADALTRHDPVAAAETTSAQKTAQKTITDTFDGMGTATADVAVNDDDTEFTWTWKLPKDRTVTYRTPVETSGDLVQWSPTVIHRKLQAGGRLLYSDLKTYDTPVTDRQNRPLLTWQEVTVVSLDASKPESATALARRLKSVAPEVSASSIRAELRGKQGAHTVVTLREEDAKRVGSLDRISGVTTRDEGRLLTAHKNLRSPATGGLEEHWRTVVDKAAGAAVSLVNADGEPTSDVQSFPGTTPDAVRTTLDVALQQAANDAVGGSKRPTMLVAIRPSTGGIVAVAQNSAADEQGPIALTGLYAPGSTFKTITTASALDAGVTTGDARLACPGSQTFGDRRIPNEDEFDLGTVPLHTAFARSCNTTMAGLSTKLGDTALRNTAQTFGLGIDYTVSGLTTITGKVPSADTPSKKVESGIGQGAVTATPFGMAVVEASLAARKTVTPTLIDGLPTAADTAPHTIPDSIATPIRSAMREAVTSGTATSLRDIPGLGGKTGTAEFGDNEHSHGWFAGIVGDLAFATLVVGGDSSAPALKVSGDFLHEAQGDLPRR